MIHVRASFLTVTATLALTLWSHAAAAQTLTGWLQKSFAGEQIDADRVRLTREVEIEGEPGSPNEGQKFFADDLLMNTRTGELEAVGNVVFSTPTSRISADKVTFNTKTQLGTFFNAHGIAQLGERGERNRSMFGTLEPDVYFNGETIEKIDRDKYRITKGGFTTCVQPTPRWYIVSGSATLNMDDYVVMRNAVVQVKDVPVFYLPLLYYPIQEDDRATGFLLPMYGSSLAMGSSISNAFFWAINRSQDATFFHDWMFTRGQGLGAEYRYLLGPAAQGDFRYYWLDEKEAVIDGQTRPARRSKQVRGGLSQNLPFGLAARARVDYITDVTVRQTYDHDFYNASNSTRSVNGGVSGSWRNLSVSSSFNQIETFYRDTSTVTGQAPGVIAALSGVKVWRLPLFATVNAEAGRSLFIQRAGTVENDSTLNKADFQPSVRAALSTLPYLQVNATAAYRTTYYSESLADDLRTQIDVPVTRSYGDMRVDVIGPVFSRVFNPNNALADRLKHIIEPSFSVSRRTEIPNQDRIPNATGWDKIVGGVSQMNYGLTNKLMVRKDQEGGEPAASAPRELLTVSLRQSYYTDEQASKYDTSYSFGYGQRRPSALSPVALTARAMPLTPMTIDYRLEYDTEAIGGAPRVLGMSLNGGWRSPNAEISAGWNRQAFATTTATGLVTEARNFLQTTSDLKLFNGRIGGLVTLNYDVAQSTLVNQRYIGFYNAQCCGVAFEFQSFNYPDNRQFLLARDRRFNMSFTLAGVGSFSNFLGAFGGAGGMR